MLGINIGSFNTSLTVHNGENFETILSENSDRTFRTLLSFENQKREYGYLSQIKMTSNLKSTFIYFNRFLGLLKNQKDFKEEKKYIHNDITIKEGHEKEELYNYKNVLFSLSGEDLPNYYSDLYPELLLGSYLTKIKDYISSNKKDFFHLTISVPDYYNLREIEALKDSIKIANIDNFNIIQEQTAICLYYGYSHRNELDEKNPVYKVFVDFGHSKTSVSVAKFTKSTYETIWSYCNRFCGGRDLDECLLKHFSDIIKNKHNIDINTNKKSILKLLNEIQRIRKILTSNKEVLVNVEYLIDDIDLHQIISREEFEKICFPILDKLKEIFIKTKQFLVSNKILDKATIEMAGECGRIPFVSSLVKEILDKSFNRTMIIDECISKGCSIHACLLNDILKIDNFRSIFTIDPFSIIYSTIPNNEYFLIKKGEPLPHRKEIILKLKKGEKFEFKLSYSKSEHDFEIELQTYLIDPKEIEISKKEEDVILDITIDIDSQIYLNSIRKKGDNKKVFNNPITLKKSNFQKYRDFITDISNVQEQMNNYDKDIDKIIEHKNEIEEKVYKLKEKLHEKNSIKHFEKLQNKLQDIENFICQSDINEPLQNQIVKICDLNKKINLIENFLNHPNKINEDKLLENENNFLALMQGEETGIQLFSNNELFHDFKKRFNHFRELIDGECARNFLKMKSTLNQGTITLALKILDKFAQYLKEIENELNLDQNKRKYSQEKIKTLIDSLENEFANIKK